MLRLTGVHAVVDLSAFGHFPLALRYLSQPLLVPHHHLDEMLNRERTHRMARDERMSEWSQPAECHVRGWADAAVSGAGMG